MEPYLCPLQATGAVQTQRAPSSNKLSASHHRNTRNSTGWSPACW